MQVVRREKPPVTVQLVHCRPVRLQRREHFCFYRHFAALAKIAGRARRCDVIPPRLAASRTRDHVIECQIVGRTAILTLKAIPKEDIKACECGIKRWLDEGFQRDDARKLHLKVGAPNGAVVKGHYVYTVKEHRLDRFLPVPEGKRVVAQRLKISV